MTYRLTRQQGSRDRRVAWRLGPLCGHFWAEPGGLGPLIGALVLGGAEP